jgi:hypothetical protein
MTYLKAAKLIWNALPYLVRLVRIGAAFIRFVKKSRDTKDGIEVKDIVKVLESEEMAVTISGGKREVEQLIKQFKK